MRNVLFVLIALALILAASAQEGEHQLAHLRELMKDD